MAQKKLVFLVPTDYVERLLSAYGEVLTDLVCILTGRDFDNLGLGLDDLREEGRQFSFFATMNQDGGMLVTYNFVDSTEGNGEKYIVESMGDFEADLVPQNL